MLFILFFDRFSVSDLLVSSFFVFFFPTTASAPTIDTFHRFFPSFFLYLLHHEVFSFSLVSLAYTHHSLSFLFFCYTQNLCNTLTISLSLCHPSFYLSAAIVNK